MKRTILFLSLVITIAACATRVPRPDSFQARGLKVGQVVLSSVQLPEEREDRADKIQLVSQVKERTEAALRAKGLYDPSSRVVMAIHINSFRLRHGATRYFTGVFSGSDRLGAQLTVSEGAATYLSKPIQVSGGNGNPFAISSSSRGANLSNDLADLAVTSLEQEGIAYTPPAQPAKAVSKRIGQAKE
jgi:hypothetical protein